ncbi:MAG: glucosamine-6-phosphate deaminase [Clostridia bacterium]|nr:glucosamine-6-phosphate deaminase [Clostridia bacterium]
MRICRFENAQQVGRAAATLITAQLLRKPDSVLGLATGSTPVPTYEELIRLYEAGVVDFSAAVSYNLDEYVGIPVDHPCSYHRFMDDNLFNHVNMRREAIHVPDGLAADLDASAAAYDDAIDAAGGVDLQVLGIGRNGHIGFNEPGDKFIYGCHVVDLTPSTIDANKRFFDSADDVPRQAVSLGIGSIMKARTVLLIATGADKAEAVRAAINGEITPAVQASILRTHPNVIFLLDSAAASLL